MGRVCDMCAKGSNRANSRSHSNIATKREQFANLQRKTVDGKSMKLCTGCIRALSKKTRMTAGA
ncbi:50S ribosomal protein L28 [Candidatus Uhrbacteria bacterium]|nr:50S ribosomal protein L28 [Candidatus Uhrbacteria bacterium]